VTLSYKIEDILSLNNFNLVHLETVDSTMTEIKKYIGSKNICMIADEQTSGVGRRGNEWISPKGNIYISFLIKYNLSIQKHFLFTAFTANSITEFLNRYINENINIKWPNDITINGKKIAGIMTEIVQKNNIQYIIIGVGINIFTSPKITDYQTCSLKDFNVNLKYENALIDLIYSYFTEYEMIINKNYNQILNKFKDRMIQLGSKIAIQLPNGDIRKVLLKNLNFDGSLLVDEGGKDKDIFSARIISDIN